MASAGKESIDSASDREYTNRPLLGADETYSGNSPRIRSYRDLRSYWPFLLHAIVFVIYSVVYFCFVMVSKAQPAAVHVYTPAESAVRYQRVKFNGSLDAINPFKGEPRPELDRAWGGLFDNINLRLSEKDLRELNTSSVELSDKSGYFGMISAYHHLHCLKYIRQVLWNNYYNVSLVNRQKHLDHCIDDIRQALMCNPDLSVLTFGWRPDQRHPWPNFEIEKVCVDWETLDEWASLRSFDILDQKSLVHPQFGISYPVIGGGRETVAPVSKVQPETRKSGKSTVAKRVSR